jgi:fructose-bisphosphate aldolase, class II
MLELFNMNKLVTTKELFKKALNEKYAIGAFNINNMELLQGIVAAGEELRSPLILQVSAGARKYANSKYLIKLAEAALETSTIPIALHLDHGEDFEICKSCIDDGFSSVMIDASKFDFEENIRLTKQVVDYAHDKGVVVEAELGTLTGIEDAVVVENADAIYTDPAKAKEFVDRSGCDSLAVAIGTSHGAYKFKSEPKLDFERLTKIKGLLGWDYPLVLHGSSSVPSDTVKICNDYGGQIMDAKGVPEEMLAEASKMGVTKINVDTDLRLTFTGQIRKFFMENPAEFDPRKYLGPARDAVKELVMRKIKVFGSENKA